MLTTTSSPQVSDTTLLAPFLMSRSLMQKMREIGNVLLIVHNYCVVGLHYSFILSNHCISSLIDFIIGIVDSGK